MATNRFDFSSIYGVQAPVPSEEDREIESIRQDFVSEVNRIEALVNSGGKQLAEEDMKPLVEVLIRGANTNEFGSLFNNNTLLVGDPGDKFATIIGVGVCGRGVITKLVHELYVPRFLDARGITWTELEQRAKASNQSIVAMLGLGSKKIFYDRLKHAVNSFQKRKGNDENVPARANINVPVNPNLQGMGQDLFGARGAPQGGVQFNQQQQSVNTETRPPFDAQFGSNMNGSSTASAPRSFGQGAAVTGNMFPNSQRGGGYYGATPSRSHVASQQQHQQTLRSELQGNSMNLDTPTPPTNNVPSGDQNGSAVPPAVGGGEYASVPNTTAPPAVVATTEDLSVASNVTHSTAGEDSASAATNRSAATAPVFQTSAANTGPVGSSASLPGVKTPATNAKRGGRKKKATFSRQTPRHAGLTRPSTDGNATHLRDNRSKNQNLLKTPGRAEAKEHVRNAGVGQTLLEEVFDGLDSDAIMNTLIVAKEKASTSHLMELKGIYPDRLKEFSDLLSNSCYLE